MTDGERGVVNAVKSLPQLLDVCCWDHVFNDIKAFVTKNGRQREEAKVYKNDIKKILTAKDEHDASTTFFSVSQKWCKLFTEYYEKHLKPLLPNWHYGLLVKR